MPPKKIKTWNLGALGSLGQRGRATSLDLGIGCHLDGIMREHYWFEAEIQDQLCYSLLSREWS